MHAGNTEPSLQELEAQLVTARALELRVDKDLERAMLEVFTLRSIPKGPTKYLVPKAERNRSHEVDQEIAHCEVKRAEAQAVIDQLVEKIQQQREVGGHAADAPDLSGQSLAEHDSNTPDLDHSIDDPSPGL